MLCQFTVKNFKSIRDEMTFDMQAASISEHNDRVLKGEDGQIFLPVSAIYGPNGGGKSNVLEAIQTLDTKVLRPIQAARQNSQMNYKLSRFPVKPFSFSEECKNQAAEFEVFFRTRVAEYRYELHIISEKIIFEKLDRVKFDTNRRSSLFERKNDGIELKGVFSKLKISEGLSNSLPLLSYLAITYMNHEVVRDIVSWFESGIDFLNYGNPLEELRTAAASSEDIKQLVLDMIREMDLDIEDFRIEERDNNRIEVYTRHVVDGYSEELSLAEESSGTQKLFSLLPFIARSLLSGTTLVIDELDAKLHPVLLKHIIMMFNDPEVNRAGAQLIFTSHDLSTMNSEIFRRDEIWFVAKGKDQNSKLYSLVEFKAANGEVIRKDARYDKQYLEGKYGADPYLKKIINWREIGA